MDTQMEQQLWEYIDGLTTEEETAVVKKRIAEQAAWREKYEELLSIQQLLRGTELETPSLRFTKNVMEEIAKTSIAPATKNYINNKIIWSIAAFFITVILGCVVYSLAQLNWSAGKDSSLNMIDLSKVDYNQLFNNSFVNIVMMANVVLGLMFLDRYLNNRKRKRMQNHLS